jgi:hypothetical protein
MFISNRPLRRISGVILPLMFLGLSGFAGAETAPPETGSKPSAAEVSADRAGRPQPFD